MHTPVPWGSGDRSVVGTGARIPVTTITFNCGPIHFLTPYGVIKGQFLTYHVLFGRKILLPETHPQHNRLQDVHIYIYVLYIYIFICTHMYIHRDLNTHIYIGPTYAT